MILKNRCSVVMAIVASSLVVSSCQTKQGSYVDPESIEILDDRWNDTDSRTTVEPLLKDVLGRPWLEEFRRENGGERPFILFGDFENRSSEHIDTKRMFEVLRAEVLRDGRARFLDGDAREKLLQEYNYQGSGIVKKDEVKGPGNQRGADFFLMGTITSQINQSGGRKRINYRTEMRLTNISTGEIVWVGDHTIAKLMQQSRVGR